MMDKTLRHALPAREASERIKDFFEVSPGFSEQTALAEAARCLSCKNAPCMKGCPVGVHIPDFIAALRTEGAQAAAAWQQAAAEVESQMLAGFTPEERAQFAAYLRRVYGNLRPGSAFLRQEAAPAAQEEKTGEDTTR